MVKARHFSHEKYDITMELPQAKSFLVEKVKKMINEGWQPLGSVMIYDDKINECRFPALVQTMVKYDDVKI